MTNMFDAHAFFFVATVAVVLLTVAVFIALIYLIRILRDTSELTHQVAKEGKDIIDDISVLHSFLRHGGQFVSKHISSLFNKKSRKK